MEDSLINKITFGLERIAEVHKSLLWKKAKVLGISPIQIQILLFISHHKTALCNVSYLAKEFNITKPTISDAVKVLDKKGFVVKDYSSSDSRSYSLLISMKGQELIQNLEDYAFPLQKEIAQLAPTQLKALYESLTQVIFQLNKSGILSTQRMCFGCKYYSNTSNAHYCNLLQKELIDQEIKLDCPEFEAKE